MEVTLHEGYQACNISPPTDELLRKTPQELCYGPPARTFQKFHHSYLKAKDLQTFGQVLYLLGVFLITFFLQTLNFNVDNFTPSVL